MIDAGAKSLLCVACHSIVYNAFDQRLTECKSKKMQFLSMLIDQPFHLIQGVKHSFQDQLEVNPMRSIINPGREQFPATDKWFIDHYRQPSQ